MEACHVHVWPIAILTDAVLENLGSLDAQIKVQCCKLEWQSPEPACKLHLKRAFVCVCYSGIRVSGGVNTAFG